jgi:FKBP-type peptidyl-prolyl cis-trans isomerase 2
VQIDYTCRTVDGAIAATTSEAVTQDADLPKAGIFAMPRAYQPVTVIAGEPAEASQQPMAQGFDEALTAALTRQVVGLSPDSSQRVEVTAATDAALPRHERFIDLARVRTRSKDLTTTLPEYEAKTGKAPEIGDIVAFEAGMTGQVVEIAGGQVTFRLEAEPGTVLATTFGPARVRDAGDHFEIDIEAEEGGLVRTGPLVGRIVNVTASMFTLDFGHPFGGEALRCEVIPVRLPGAAETAQASHE